MHVDEGSYFWSAKKVINSTHTELESFVELVAGMSTTGFELGGAEAAAVRFKENSAEFAGAIDPIASGSEQNMSPLLKSAVVRQAMRDSAQVQARAQLGEDAGAESPLFEGGLVASADGLFWERAAV